MKIWMIPLGVLLGPALGYAQSEYTLAPLPKIEDDAGINFASGLATPEGTAYEVSRTRLDRHTSIGLSFIGRASFPGYGYIANNASITYSDIFDVGGGASFIFDIMAKPNPEVELGGYVSLGYDYFGGRSVSLLNPFTGDVLGIKPDSLDVSTIVLGGKILGRVAPYCVTEGYLGFGFVHYSSVDATFTLNGVPNPDQQFFGHANRGLFEIGGRIGFGSPSVMFVLGFGWRLMGSLGRGRDAGAFLDMNPDLFDTIILDGGLTIRF
jgi:hypothetical protein